MAERYMFEEMLNQLRKERIKANKDAVDDLWKRNGLLSTDQKRGYKLATTKTSQHDGTEVVEHRLYKLIDSTVVTIEGKVRSKTETGRDAVVEGKPSGIQAAIKNN